MTYQETLCYLYASQPAFHLVGAAAYKPGFQNTIALLQHLRLMDDKQHWLGSFPAIHVAGTNGKGSCSHLIAACLQANGLKVGLYTSPHLVDFRERIRISGQMIPEEEVVRYVAENKDFLDTLKPSFFESSMALAFRYFEDKKVDVAVIEVGLGGRLDSTNILPPANANHQAGVVLSLITNIGLDHTEFLGNTLSQIAAEKAGIMKPGVPCVIGETHPETMPVFLERAQTMGILGEGLETSDCRIWFADQCGYLARCRQRDIPQCQLHGIYQERNMQTAYVALSALHSLGIFSLSAKALAKGFAEVCTLTGLRGRWEVLSSTPLTICDTGHNSHGLQYVSKQLQQLLEEDPSRRLYIVFDMVDDKDVDVVMQHLPHQAFYFFATASTHRAVPATQMRNLWLKHGGNSANTAVFDSVPQAVRAAQEKATDKDIIFIGGSNYVVGEALRECFG
ncbi:MAG: bifunctional folylpolyglutamate synthase/dihydrofolate synthase [Paludibacteraceae bacterium]|nr:bifunctional folylpolyglutamate synthase/dihydrofolate synthase [Paludibacteraceae bacterium]